MARTLEGQSQPKSGVLGALGIFSCFCFYLHVGFIVSAHHSLCSEDQVPWAASGSRSYSHIIREESICFLQKKLENFWERTLIF